MITVRQYVDRQGTSPFEQWMDSLDDVAAARVLTTVTRIGQGNFSSVKGVGGGVFESRIDFGPGYRVYCGQDGATVVILLGGGTGIFVGHREGFEAMNRAIALHRLRPVVDSTFPLEDVKEAFRRMEKGEHFGKICLRHEGLARE